MKWRPISTAPKDGWVLLRAAKTSKCLDAALSLLSTLEEREPSWYPTLKHEPWSGHGLIWDVRLEITRCPLGPTVREERVRRTSLPHAIALAALLTEVERA